MEAQMSYRLSVVKKKVGAAAASMSSKEAFLKAGLAL
jgi:hypothetical protein